MEILLLIVTPVVFVMWLVGRSSVSTSFDDCDCDDAVHEELIESLKETQQLLRDIKRMK